LRLEAGDLRLANRTDTDRLVGEYGISQDPPDWLTGRLANRLTGEPANRPTGGLANRPTGGLADWRTGRLANRPTGGPMFLISVLAAGGAVVV